MPTPQAHAPNPARLNPKPQADGLSQAEWSWVSRVAKGEPPLPALQAAFPSLSRRACGAKLAKLLGKRDILRRLTLEAYLEGHSEAAENLLRAAATHALARSLSASRAKNPNLRAQAVTVAQWLLRSPSLALPRPSSESGSNPPKTLANSGDRRVGSGSGQMGNAGVRASPGPRRPALGPGLGAVTDSTGSGNLADGEDQEDEGESSRPRV